MVFHVKCAQDYCLSFAAVLCVVYLVRLYMLLYAFAIAMCVAGKNKKNKQTHTVARWVLAATPATSSSIDQQR